MQTILNYYENNKPKDEETVENFHDFQDIWQDDEDERKILLEHLFCGSKGTASIDTYTSIIKIAILLERFEENFENGEVKMGNELKKLIQTTEKPSVILKKS
jgi:hypothetical protein